MDYKQKDGVCVCACAHVPRKAEERIQTMVTVQPTRNTYIPKPHSQNVKKYA
jgi:hypothetical protein